VPLFEERSACSGFALLQSQIRSLLNPLSKVSFRTVGKWLGSTGDSVITSPIVNLVLVLQLSPVHLRKNVD